MIKLVNDTINNEDIDALSDWLKTYPRLTKGPLTVEYESKWSDYLEIKHSTFVNSGSSANLLMLAALIENKDLALGDSVIVPAVSWATDLAPVMQLGLRPILCDCNLEDLSFDLTHFARLLEREKPKAAILVSVLGLVPDMESIIDLCNKHNTILLEDCCESLGSEYKGKKLGTFGAMSSFSTYFGHHISTIEGGMVCTNDDSYDDILKSIRSHGWDRDWAEEKQNKIRSEWNVSKFDSLYTFYYKGFNVRATDLQAFIGIRQLDRLDEICNARNENFNVYNDLFQAPVSRDYVYVSNFAYPIIAKDKYHRDMMITKLKDHNIEVRPLICGSMGQQPFYTKEYGVQPLPSADRLKDCAFYVPNHPSLEIKDINLIVNIIQNNE
tara:strand:- start:1270 stop:2418 length:1149 start_codon:yes stop_codon:yes gene_type:complete